VPTLQLPSGEIKAEPGFTEIVLVDVLNGTMQTRKIRLGNRYGGWVQWADDDTLLVGTERRRFETDGVAVVRRDGTVLGWHPWPADPACEASPEAMPPYHDGKLLTCTTEGSTQVYRAFDPRRGTTGPELGRVSPGMRAIPVSWDGGDTVLLKLFDPKKESADVRIARLPAGLLGTLPRDLPYSAHDVLVGSSDGLSPAGWKLTF
jgi:hypothetical protein